MSARNDIKSVSRRDFLRYTSVAGGALVLGTLLPSITPAWASSTVVDAVNTLNLFVSIDNDGTVNIVRLDGEDKISEGTASYDGDTIDAEVFGGQFSAEITDGGVTLVWSDGDEGADVEDVTWVEAELLSST